MGANRRVLPITTNADQQIQIRPAVSADAPSIARIYVDSWNSGFGDLMGFRTLSTELTDLWRDDLAQPLPQRWWVAVLQDLTIGFVGIGLSRDPVQPCLGELDTIAVSPAHWRQGVGRVLMAMALRHLVADGYDEAILWTVEDYSRGQAFYESAGWTRDGATRDHGRQIRYRHRLAVQ